jgi:hypothetical protein
VKSGFRRVAVMHGTTGSRAWKLSFEAFCTSAGMNSILSGIDAPFLGRSLPRESNQLLSKWNEFHSEANELHS